MTLDWVWDTKDSLFRNLSRPERLLLYLVFVREMKWEQVAATLQISVSGARKKLNAILSRIRSWAALTPSEKDA